MVFIQTISPKVLKGLADAMTATSKVDKSKAKRVVVTLNSLVKFVKQIAFPLTFFNDLIGRLGGLFSIILEPLQPFLDLIDIFGMWLSAILVPLQVFFYAGMMGPIQELMDTIGPMNETMNQYILLLQLQDAIIAGDTETIQGLLTELETMGYDMDSLGTILDETGAIADTAGQEVEDAISTTFESWSDQAADAISNFFESAEEILLSMKGVLLPIFKILVEYLSEAMTDMAPTIAAVLLEIMGATWAGFWEGVLGSATLQEGWLAGWEAFATSPFGGYTTYLQHGGIVTRPIRAEIGEAGPEAVIPLDRMGGMGGNIEIHIHGNIFGFENFKEVIISELEREKRLGRI